MAPEAFKSGSETTAALDVWAIGCMFYAMLFGHLPFWGETEDEFIDKIINQALRFEAEVPVTQECKECMKGMLDKNPEKRSPLIDIMNLPYFMMDDEELEEKIKIAE